MDSYPRNISRNLTNRLEILIEIVVGLFAILLGSLFLFLSVPIYFFRCFIIIYAKINRKDLDEILNGMSAYLVNDYFDNKAPRANIVVPFIINGHVTFEEINYLIKKHWIQTTDKRFKQFCQYPVRWMGFTFYKKATASFQIENHVHLYSKEKGENGKVTEEELTNFTENLLNSPFLPFMSPWEVHLVQNYKNDKISTKPKEGLSVFIFKVHHSLTDGFGIISALVEAFSRQTVADLKIPKPKYPKKEWWKRLASFMILSIKLVKESGHYIRQSWRPCPWKIPDDLKQWYQFCFRSDLVPIEQLHTVKRAFGATLSSIMYTAVSAALEKSLKDLKETPLSDNVGIRLKGLKRDGSIFCLHPIPLPDHPMSLTNHVTLTFLDFPTHEYESSLDRLHNVNLVLKTSRDSSCIPWILPWLMFVLGCHLYPISKYIVKNRAISYGVTNFPADILHFEINGKKAIAADCIAGALDGVMGVAVMVLSYGQYIRVVATADGAVMCRENVKKFGNYIVNEIKILYSMAQKNQ